MRFNLLFCVVLALASSNLFAQADSKQFRKTFNEADAFLNIDNTPQALKIFSELWPQDSTNANLNYKIGMCYIKSKAEKKKAISYLQIATLNLSDNYIEFEASEKTAPYNALYLLAKSYHNNNQFSQAETQYTKYLIHLKQTKGDKKEINIIEKEIERCKFGAEAIKKPTRIKVENLGENINSIYPDYAPLISADESVLIFTTRRKSMFNGNDNADGNNKYNDDIYISYKEGTEWQEAKPLNAFINTKENDATVGLSADGQQLFLYKEGDIYVSKLDGDNWTAAVKLNENINTKYFEPSATISSDGNTLYFVSDRKGGFGGRDIYKSIKLPDGEWGAAQNLGPNINTDLDDEGPFVSFDNRSLYFSSMGHNSIGGYDLFVSRMNEEGVFQKPENLGYPVNTANDDIFFVTTPDEKHAYYSSEKEGTFGETDIYKITFEEKIETEITVLAGKIVNIDGGPLSSNIEIIVNEVSGKIPTQYYRPNTKTGKYIFSLVAGSTYEILYLVAGTEFNKEILDVPEGTGYQIINREINLKAVGYGKKHTDKAITAEEQDSKIDTTNAEIKVNGMSNAAIALVNNIKQETDSAKASNKQLANTNTTSTTNSNKNNEVNKTENNTQSNAKSSNKSEPNTIESNSSKSNSTESNTSESNSTESNTSELTQNNETEVTKTTTSTNTKTTTTTSVTPLTTNSTQGSNAKTQTTTTTSTQTNSVTNTVKTLNTTKIKAVHFLFGFNQSTLSDAALRDLRKLARIMKTNPSLTLQIEGHTDSIGSDKYNLILSARRAKSVKNYLVSLGVPAARIKSEGIGEIKPIAINANQDGTNNKRGMVYNRRIDLILNQNQEDYIEPIELPNELKIKQEEIETVKTKF